MLALSKALLMQHRETVAGRWPRVAQQPLRGRTLGIIGLGRTGKAVATRALAFGMNILAADPYVDDTFAKALGIRLTSHEDVFRTADIVTLHVPLTPETRNLVNANTLALMKPSAYLVNTARGEVVNEADLFAALTAKKIAAAGLDVFEHEPLVGSPLQTLDNVILTAHTAGVDLRSREDMVNFAAQAIAKLFAGEWPTEWIVNPELKGTWRPA
jgi:phosphoglycerate dehydrogenase-like enzyme